MKTVYLIIGTRPEAIKMAPVFRALEGRTGLDVKLVSTGQHRELLRQTLDSFGLRPSIDLNVMRPGQSLSGLTAHLLLGLENLFRDQRPDLILTHGDTTTCYATALSAFYHSIPFFHVEAGLRTFRLDSPHPEEFNRQCVSRMAAHHFAPSVEAKKNLLGEGVDDRSISVVGSTVYDAIQLIRDGGLSVAPALQNRLQGFKRTALFTLHRREGSSPTLERVMVALKEAAKEAASRHPETAFVFPVHPNPRVKALAESIFSGERNVILTEALDYPVFLSLLNSASLVLTDSGGVQEEAAYFGKRTLILRDTTERHDGLTHLRTEVIGTEPETIVSRISTELLQPMIGAMNLPRNGRSASAEVAQIVEEKCLA